MEQNYDWTALDEVFQNGTPEQLKRLIQDNFSQVPPDTILHFIFESRPEDEAFLTAFQKLATDFDAVLIPAIYAAARSERWQLVQKIIKKFRPDVMRMRDENGFPILYFAASSGNLDIVKWLVTYGAKLNSADPNCFLILQAAIPRADRELIQFLIQECHFSPHSQHEQAQLVMEAAGHGNRDLLEFLLDLWQIPSAILQSPELLHSAAKRGSLEMVRFLLKQGANVHRPVQHETVLHAAVIGGSLEIVKLIMEFAKAHPAPKGFFSWGNNSLRLDARDAQGKTALDLAKEKNLTELIDFFMQQ